MNIWVCFHWVTEQHNNISVCYNPIASSLGYKQVNTGQGAFQCKSNCLQVPLKKNFVRSCQDELLGDAYFPL